MSEVKVNKWISVKDRLPVQTGDYLVFYEGRSDIGFFFEDQGLFDASSAEFPKVEYWAEVSEIAGPGKANQLGAVDENLLSELHEMGFILESRVISRVRHTIRHEKLNTVSIVDGDDNLKEFVSKVKTMGEE